MSASLPLNKYFRNNASAVALVAATALTSVGCGSIPLTQDEGRIGGATIGGAIGAILTDGESRTVRKAGTAIGGALGGVAGGVFADKQTTCRDETKTTRQGTRDNTTGEITRDQSTTQTTTECEGNRRHEEPVSNTPVFN